MYTQASVWFLDRAVYVLKQRVYILYEDVVVWGTEQ